MNQVIGPLIKLLPNKGKRVAICMLIETFFVVSDDYIKTVKNNMAVNYMVIIIRRFLSKNFLAETLIGKIKTW